MPASTSAIASWRLRGYLLARHCLGPNAYSAEQIRLFSAGTPSQASNQGVAKFLRADLVAQGTAAKLLSGKQAVLGNRPDLEFYKEKESQLLAELQAIAPQYRTRPSMLGPVFSALGFGTGAVTALLPRNLQGAVAAAVQEALQEQYNDQLRELATGKEGHVKELLKRLRDADRMPTDVKVPDLAMLQRPQELTLEEGVAGVVKMAFSGLMGLTLRVFDSLEGLADFLVLLILEEVLRKGKLNPRVLEMVLAPGHDLVKRRVQQLGIQDVPPLVYTTTKRWLGDKPGFY